MTSPLSLPRIRIEIAADAWPRIGRLPSDAFRRVRQLLEKYSDDAGTELSKDADEDQEPQDVTIKVDGFLVLCSFDPERRILSVRDIVASGE